MTLSLLPGSAVEITIHTPGSVLLAHVDAYWTLRVVTPPATVHVVPDGLVDLIFDLQRREVYVGGTNLVPVAYTHTHAAHLLGASLKPGTALQLLGVPASSLTPEWQRLEDVIGPAANALADLVFDAPSARERFALLDAFLVARLFATSSEPRIQGAIAIILAQDGAVDIETLGRSAGVSPRNLGRLFDDWVGMPPKRFARVVRLQSTLRRLQENPNMDLTQLALESGYADHAHLTREMQAIAGISPSALAERLR
jgi:AraC-like DNA-binding protein